MRRSRRLLVVAAGPVVGLALLFWAWAGAGPSAAPYDPSSTAPGGGAALAEVLHRLGEHFEPAGAFPSPGQGVAVVLYDQLTPAARSQLLAWVKRGGILVVADPSSPLEQVVPAQGGPNQPLAVAAPLAPRCSAPWARGVSLLGTAGAPLLEVPRSGQACFRAGDACFAVEVQLGHGGVVSLASAAPWSNSELGRYDNARLAVDLLAPVPGGGISWVTRPWVAGGGTRSLWSLVPVQAKALMAALAVAVVAACAWRGRRLGRPVAEAPLVPIPGSELVVASGRLLARSRQPAEVGAVLRADACSRLATAFGLGPGWSAATLARVTAERTGLPERELAAAFGGPLPGSDQQLVHLACLLQEARRKAAGA